MEDGGDPFDLVRIAPEQLPEMAAKQKPIGADKPPRRRRTLRADKFVMLPYEQILKAAGQLGNVSLALIIELAYLKFKKRVTLVPLTNVALRAIGIRRQAKVRALHRLEKVGLVKMVRRGKRSVLVEILWE